MYFLAHQVNLEPNSRFEPLIILALLQVTRETGMTDASRLTFRDRAFLQALSC